VIVSAHNEGKRSVQMQVYDEVGTPVEVGSVTIPPNKDIPEVGSVIEVTYLYAYEGGSLFQPVFNKERNDVLPDECTESQLKYKAEHNPSKGMKP
jgi:bifunctional non-homologous end joining protein LigD